MPALGVIDSLCSVCHMVSLTTPLWSVIASRGLLDLCPEITSVLISCLFNLSNLPPNQPAHSVSWVCAENAGQSLQRRLLLSSDNATNWTYRSFLRKKVSFYNKLLVACLVCFCTLLGGLIWGEENSAWPRPLWHTICYPGPFTFLGLLISSFFLTQQDVFKTRSFHCAANGKSRILVI